MCLSAYRCGPVKEVKNMKARTRSEREVLKMAEELPPVTEAQKKWGFNLFEKNGIYWKKGLVWCQCCGHVDKVDKSELAVSLELEQHVCPHCGAVLKVEHWSETVGVESRREKHDYKGFVVMTTHKGWNVFRCYDVERWNMLWKDGRNYVKGDNITRYYIREVFQRWINESGKEVIVSRGYYRSPFSFQWNYCSEWRIKKHNGSANGYFMYEDVYDLSNAYVYPNRHVTSLIRRNGWDNRLTSIGDLDPAVLMVMLLTHPIAEELVKTGQWDVLRYWINTGSGRKNVSQWIHSMRICNRNHYIVKDASMWFDYLDLLRHFGKDTHNAHYVCPDNLQEAHDRLVRKRQEEQRRKEEEERRKLIAKYEKQYYDHRKNFFGVSFSDGTIVVKVLNSVREIADEGKAMRHCVFTNEYYDHRKHPSSLILSARDNNDNRIETVEVNINTWKIVQSRGVCNSRTAKHEQICRLVEQNMFKLKQKAI